jgi:hypothetical protein
MSGAGIAGFLLWLLVALPSLAFVFLPAAVVLIWLAAFWLVEMFFYLALRPFRRAVRRPRLLVRMS